MSKALITEDYLTDIADAIRAKNGSSDTYTPAQMAEAIESIPTGGTTPTGTVNINQNGTHNVMQYASANVNVPNSYAPGDEGKVVKNGALATQTSRSVTANGTYDTTENNSTVVNVPNSYTSVDEGKVVSNGALVGQTSTTKTANGTYDTTQNNQVVIDVPNSYAAGDEGKVVSGGTLVPQSARPSAITVNGTYDTTNNNSVQVNVSGSSAVLVTKSIIENGQYSAASDNADGYSSVNVNVPNTYGTGDEGKVVSGGGLVAQTPTTKNANGTYDTTTNNRVVIDVPNTYTAADEGKVVDNGALVAQTARSTQITENGTYDTTNNNSVEVNVAGGGGTLISKTITQNGVYNASADAADGYSTVTVNVPTVIGFESEVTVVSGTVIGDATLAFNVATVVTDVSEVE